MASDTEFIRERLQGEAVVAIAQGMAQAVALTPEALVTGKRGLFGRWGTAFERYPLDQLVGGEIIPNPTAMFLRLDFGGGPSIRTVRVLVPADSRSAFEPIIAALQQRLARVQEAAS